MKLQLVLRSLAVIVTALVANWWSVLPAGVLLCGLLLIRWYFLKTAREVKRLEAIGIWIVEHGHFIPCMEAACRGVVWEGLCVGPLSLSLT